MNDFRIMSDEQLSQLAATLGEQLQAKGWRVSLAESCTGGWIAKTLTDVSGSSGWFECSWVSYSNQAKSRMLGVAPAVIDEHGAVSEAVVEAMAEGARREAGSQLALAVSGVAGPGGGTPDKPVGMVCFAIATEEKTVAWVAKLAGDRDTVRRASVGVALEALLSASA